MRVSGINTGFEAKVGSVLSCKTGDKNHVGFGCAKNVASSVLGKVSSDKFVPSKNIFSNKLGLFCGLHNGNEFLTLAIFGTLLLGNVALYCLNDFKKSCMYDSNK